MTWSVAEVNSVGKCENVWNFQMYRNSTIKEHRALTLLGELGPSLGLQYKQVAISSLFYEDIDHPEAFHSNQADKHINKSKKNEK